MGSANPAPLAQPQYAPGLGLNPAPWEVIDLYARRAICRKHRIELERRSGPLTNTGAPKWVRYDCPSRDLNGNARGYCKTGGWINEIFEEDVK